MLEKRFYPLKKLALKSVIAQFNQGFLSEMSQNT